MCVVSMVMDHYNQKWNELIQQPYQPNFPREPAITDAEIREFRTLLARAREYDKRNNEPDCELEAKKQQLLDLAKQLGVEIEIKEALAAEKNRAQAEEPFPLELAVNG